MGQYNIQQGAIGISYGWDHVTGYFLRIVDERLSWNEDATDAVNAIAEEVSAEGSGDYFNLHTGQTGFGHKVDVATLAAFWEAYGVPSQHVQKARAGQKL